ncbi:uncharacterized protein LOC100908391 [Galendromus occidentalis]|uniref:Uncharacterized protein LOC100908391 n=1 Tax=Galendromus occidentalis TaxID=34638 RepID=A0AAJ6QMS5_9ACAR|nr:uncharacterized protein LOC100908391 [Galendromus occidentalis]
MNEEETKRRLKTLRQSRTIRRNKAMAELEAVTDLHSGNPTFAEGQRPEELLILMTQHVERIRELDGKIADLASEDAVDAEATASEEFHIEIERGIAAISAVTQVGTGDLAAQAEMPTFYGTPEAMRHVRSRPTMNSTMSAPRQMREATQVPDSSPQPAAQVVSTTTARLPRELDISPEVFAGDRLRYRAFITQFKCFVGKRPEATPAEKLMVLRKYVTGEPRDIVQALELSDGNIATLASNGIPLTDFALSLRSAIEAALPIRLRQDYKDSRRLEKKLLALTRGGSGEGSTADDCIETADEESTTDADDSGTSVSTRAAKEVRNLIDFLRGRVRDWEDNRYLDERASPATAEVPERPAQARDVRRRPKSTIAGAASRPSGSAGTGYRPRPCLFCRTADHNSSRCTASFSIAKRREILTAQRRCEKCFRTKHANPADCRGPKAPCASCGSRQHYTSMHGPDSPRHGDQTAAGSDATTAAVVQTVSGASADTGALLLTACAYVINGGVKIPIRVFMDPGSTLTVMLPSLRAMLRDPPVGVSNLTIQAFASTLASERIPLYNIRIMNIRGGPTIELFAHEYKFDFDPPNTTTKAVLQALSNFDRESPLADRTYVGEWSRMPPALLIGMNQLHKVMHRELPQPVVDDITAQSSKLGWLVGGSIPLGQHHIEGEVTATHIVCCAAGLSARQSLQMSSAARALETLWSLEALGISDPPAASQMSADEEEATRQFNSEISFEDGHYVVSFPKRPSISQLQNNLGVASQRLERKLSQLRQYPMKYRRYHAEVMKFIDDGFAVEVRDFSPGSRSEVDGSYYMPHHEVVVTSEKAEKWRIVFDCSAKQKGASSLNDHLLPGPNLNPDLVSLLLNFRLHSVAVSADVSKAYMRIAVAPADRPLFRFLWKGPDADSVRAYQMQRVTWGAASSGFLLAATIRHHLQGADPASQDLSKCLYADDFLQSFEDPQRDSVHR